MTQVQPQWDTERLTRLCKALASPVRLEIVRFVAAHPRCIGNQILLRLPHRTSCAQSTLSQHLKVLCDAGVLDHEPDGPATCYTLNADALRWMQDCLRVL
jgi:ArsR family transcriptional regulator